MINDVKKHRKRAAFSGVKSPNDTMLFISSNTVMAVVPDSNRIPFYIYSANNFSNRIFLSNYSIFIYEYNYTDFSDFVKCFTTAITVVFEKRNSDGFNRFLAHFYYSGSHDCLHSS